VLVLVRQGDMPSVTESRKRLSSHTRREVRWLEDF
jgi:hypothetical protein